MIAKESLEEWQQVEGSITEAEILMKVSHENILKVSLCVVNIFYNHIFRFKKYSRMKTISK